ncbi:MAG TPA: hypothetical protein VGE83_02010, partial [Terracidiphilus sp.]
KDCEGLVRDKAEIRLRNPETNEELCPWPYSTRGMNLLLSFLCLEVGRGSIQERRTDSSRDRES